MEYFRRLLLENKAWAKEKKLEDENYFQRLSKGQNPYCLWIGCSDSRVAVNEITNTEPGDIFVHRNIANLVVPDDRNLLSVLQYSIDVLKVPNIIVCGHYACGGVLAAISDQEIKGPIQEWLKPIGELAARNKKQITDVNQVVELSVLEQVEKLKKIEIIQQAWLRQQELTIHGWVFDMHTGIIRDLIKIKEPVASIPQTA